MPYDLELLVSIETDDRDSLEKELHEKFADKRKKGEWFDLTEEDIAYIKGLGNRRALKPAVALTEEILDDHHSTAMLFKVLLALHLCWKETSGRQPWASCACR